MKKKKENNRHYFITLYVGKGVGGMLAYTSLFYLLHAEKSFTVKGEELLTHFFRGHVAV